MSVTAFFQFAEGSELLAQIAGDIQEVEQELEAQMSSPVQTVEEIGRHTLKAGGKRLRPAFVALAAKATLRPYERPRTIKLGACMEMIHMATLIHDDVIDNASTRRGLETASAIFGATPSILSGDALLARAMVILAQDGDLEIIRNVARSVVEMAEGEVREVASRNQFNLSEMEHLEILRMKTAAFIESCCDIGAIVGSATPSERAALRSYGYHTGMAFQIVDDLLDYTGDQETMGKPQASDFREGCATLPLIYLRPLLSESELDVARHKFGNGVADDELVMIADWMRDRGAFDRAFALAQTHVKQALSSLDALPESEAKELLEAAAQFVVSRRA